MIAAQGKIDLADNIIYIIINILRADILHVNCSCRISLN